MRLVSYLNEEYYTRVGKYEIFFNPDKKEVISLFKNAELSLRALVDFDSGKVFMFDWRLLHQSAAKNIAMEYKGPPGYFQCVEIFASEIRDGIAFAAMNDGFKIGEGWASNNPKSPPSGAEAYLKKKFGYLKAIL